MQPAVRPWPTDRAPAALDVSSNTVSPHDGFLLLSRGFQALAWILGLPALAGTVFFGGSALLLWWAGPRSAAAGSGSSGDGMVDVILGIGRLFGMFFRFLGVAGNVLVLALFAVFIVALAGAGLLFWIGSSLPAGGVTARLAAGVVLAIAGLVGGITMMSGRRSLWSIGGGLLLAACGYGLWLAWG